ncbi:thioredoxin family protein [Piscinibacter gummiphilus]|uniref:Thioredoxin family protein n=1 Tax=Piscinibacter gummiphilus TaxID=946333 RepID=A0ABZ0CV19_9BURK|nr:thioredoxin family protein [Piscinibacter gummiphilus]WOB06810.1 thioredoxin family protein [Piscinibacter gummiphilus]
MSTAETLNHPIVTRDRWVAERKALLAREKEMSRLSDELARERRKLPWVLVDKPYVFDTPTGQRTLADLFEGRRQLIVQHFMLAPGWEEGCASCSFMADHVDGALPHLAARDLSFVAVSRAPLAEIERFKRRMGWQFPWVSSNGCEFNFDFHVSFTPEERKRGEVFYNYGMTAFPLEEAPGVSAFILDEKGQVFHTYSTYGRGVELMMGAYDLIDITPKGRDEAGLPYTMGWVRHHDRYDTAKKTGSACGCEAS